ncbi:YciE/YciF family protein [Brucella endophytica]|uniref:YciE/YciF family protein n=1 Tax=Brucella endophytica TaxID=1963359 RepID=A0A916SJ02_9HYPH|nr:ferritin-like domain-containing protein [Brucella endophytica]GGB02520.1 YciE/YciF family protein [Brucella endophytica]
MSNMDEWVNQWLRDAHAMEEQAEQMLSAQASRLENYPQLRARIEQHLAETKSQRERIARCIEQRGGSTSTIKDAAGKLTAMMQGLGGVMAGDEVVKGTLASYTFEHMEIASYRILVAAAKAAGDMTTARVCEEICREEEAMAEWLADHANGITQEYLRRDSAELETAKR